MRPKKGKGMWTGGTEEDKIRGGCGAVLGAFPMCSAEADWGSGTDLQSLEKDLTCGSGRKC